MVRVTAHFNDTWGGSFRRGVNAESDRRYEEYGERLENREADRRPFDGFETGDVLVESSYGEVTFGDLIDADDVLNIMYRKMNADGRKNGRTERSLSVGDVLRVERDGEVKWFAVARVGFEEEVTV